MMEKPARRSRASIDLREKKARWAGRRCHHLRPPREEPQPVLSRRCPHRPGAGLDARRLPAAASGKVEEDAGGGADIEERAVLRDELFGTAQDAQEILGPARGLVG